MGFVETGHDSRAPGIDLPGVRACQSLHLGCTADRENAVAGKSHGLGAGRAAYPS